MCERHTATSTEWTGTHYSCNECEYERRVKADSEPITDANATRYILDVMDRKPLR